MYRAGQMRPKPKDKLSELREESKTFTTIEPSHDSQLHKRGIRCVRRRHALPVMKTKILSCTGRVLRHCLAPSHWGSSMNTCHQHREPHADQLQLKLHSFANPPAGVGAKGCNQGSYSKDTSRKPLLGEEMLSLEEKCRRMYEYNRFVGQ
ncbi:hypothetical protein E2C01_012675 [Portunus trituberculatus]|uniref:Uncharacterized protein n=1 Tax=Portunus trituberculatus TaxID=210409 RepID=A0A5B7DEI2_PORTR|nr:hypothetical protein [Portunus trituberculatus]